MAKELSRSKLEQAVAAINFRYFEVEKVLNEKLKAPKYNKGKVKLPHFAYTKH